MKKVLSFLSVATLLAVMSVGCSIYHPQAVDIPLINHQGDLRVDANASASVFVFIPDAMNINLTGSYGFNNWLAGQAHINYGFENYYAHLAPGAYLPLGEHGLLEGYAGLGVGGAWRRDTSSYYDYHGHYNLPFAQVNIGCHDLTGAHIDFAFGFKTGVYMPDFEYNDYDANGVRHLENCYRYTNPSLLLEPQLMFRVGSEHVKFCLRGSFTWLSDMMGTDNSGNSHNFTSDLFTVGAGLNFSF